LRFGKKKARLRKKERGGAIRKKGGCRQKEINISCLYGREEK